MRESLVDDFLVGVAVGGVEGHACDVGCSRPLLG